MHSIRVYWVYGLALISVLILDFKRLNPKHDKFVHDWCCGCDGQELLRRARSTALKTERRTSSWFWRTAWRSASATNPRSSSWSRKCSTFPRRATGRRWNKSSRAFWTGRRSGQPKSASHVSSEVQLSVISKYVCIVSKEVIFSVCQWIVLRVCRRRIRRVRVTRTSRCRWAKPRREPRPSTAISIPSGTRAFTCECLNGNVHVPQNLFFFLLFNFILFKHKDFV